MKRQWSTRSNKVRDLEETAPERWRYLVYRNGKPVEVTKEQYDALYRPAADEQG